ncbi:MAG: hypothetical protein OEZ07_01255 [Dehalococcoidia bacterium]|nr:hypothetical protein [Dehalococcoidia bacterium]MDH5781184.1 hypothetical protein [Dehalococcoidia bacterium]
MARLYNVSIINKHDIWLKKDEENPISWIVMSKEQLEQHLQRQIRRKEEIKGRAIIGYDDIVWNKFM